MKLTLDFLKENSACTSGIRWYHANEEPNTVEACISALMVDTEQPSEKLSHANWLLSETLTEPDCRRYAIFAARQVLDIYEKRYPTDNRPRLAIEAAGKYLEGEISKEELHAASAAAWAAAGDAARDDASAAAWAAGDAAGDDARDDASAVAWAAGDAAGDAAGAVGGVAWDAAQIEVLTKIINYGLTLVPKN